MLTSVWFKHIAWLTVITLRMSGVTHASKIFSGTKLSKIDAIVSEILRPSSLLVTSTSFKSYMSKVWLLKGSPPLPVSHDMP